MCWPMATRKKKTFAPLSWLRAWRQRLTSRMACFVWGAILGNAVLSHPIQPLNESHRVWWRLVC